MNSIKSASSLNVKQLDEDGLFDLIRKRTAISGSLATSPEPATKALLLESSSSRELAKPPCSKTSPSIPSPISLSLEKLNTHKSCSPEVTQLTGRPCVPLSHILTANRQCSETSKIVSSRSPNTKPMTKSHRKPTIKSFGGPPSPVSDSPSISDGLLWSEKYRPTTRKQLVGQMGNSSPANRLFAWLSAWHNHFIAGS
ncbi:unnamed protein product [Protopolystoma xenopodis]|uniref:Uncharacterized protein n=1 Tax=Protopolystoma xenopodis TaxID=117903 RepID=A0A3S5AL50_9PLAT|nr:unnamed protein product [Protopolystoma xenopodis]